MSAELRAGSQAEDPEREINYNRQWVKSSLPGYSEFSRTKPVRHQKASPERCPTKLLSELSKWSLDSTELNLSKTNALSPCTMWDDTKAGMRPRLLTSNHRSCQTQLPNLHSIVIHCWTLEFAWMHEEDGDRSVTLDTESCSWRMCNFLEMAIYSQFREARHQLKFWAARWYHKKHHECCWTYFHLTGIIKPLVQRKLMFSNQLTQGALMDSAKLSWIYLGYHSFWS